MVASTHLSLLREGLAISLRDNFNIDSHFLGGGKGAVRLRVETRSDSGMSTSDHELGRDFGRSFALAHAHIETGECAYY